MTKQKATPSTKRKADSKDDNPKPKKRAKPEEIVVDPEYQRISGTLTIPMYETLTIPVSHIFHNTYYPQMKDEVAFFRDGYLAYIRSIQVLPDWKNYVNPIFRKFSLLDHGNDLPDVMFCQIVDIEYRAVWIYHNRIPFTVRKLKLMVKDIPPLKVGKLTEKQLRLVGNSFEIDYIDHTQCMANFMILKVLYDSAIHFLENKLRVGMKVHCSFDGAFVAGSVKEIGPKDPSRPNSLWEGVNIHWLDGSESETRVSVWEIKEVEDYTDLSKKIPLLDETARIKALREYEEISKPDTIRKIPMYDPSDAYPVLLESVKRRLENKFYHTPEMLLADTKHIVKTIAKNKKSEGIKLLKQFGANVEKIVEESMPKRDKSSKSKASTSRATKEKKEVTDKNEKKKEKTEKKEKKKEATDKKKETSKDKKPKKAEKEKPSSVTIKLKATHNATKVDDDMDKDLEEDLLSLVTSKKETAKELEKNAAPLAGKLRRPIPEQPVNFEPIINSISAFTGATIPRESLPNIPKIAKRNQAKTEPPKPEEKPVENVVEKVATPLAAETVPAVPDKLPDIEKKSKKAETKKEEVVKAKAEKAEKPKKEKSKKEKSETGESSETKKKSTKKKKKKKDTEDGSKTKKKKRTKKDGEEKKTTKKKKKKSETQKEQELPKAEEIKIRIRVKNPEAPSEKHETVISPAIQEDDLFGSYDSFTSFEQPPSIIEEQASDLQMEDEDVMEIVDTPAVEQIVISPTPLLISSPVPPPVQKAPSPVPVPFRFKMPITAKQPEPSMDEDQMDAFEEEENKNFETLPGDLVCYTPDNISEIKVALVARRLYGNGPTTVYDDHIHVYLFPNERIDYSQQHEYEQWQDSLHNWSRNTPKHKLVIGDDYQIHTAQLSDKLPVYTSVRDVFISVPRTDQIDRAYYSHSYANSQCLFYRLSRSLGKIYDNDAHSLTLYTFCVASEQSNQTVDVAEDWEGDVTMEETKEDTQLNFKLSCVMNEPERLKLHSLYSEVLESIRLLANPQKLFTHPTPNLVSDVKNKYGFLISDKFQWYPEGFYIRIAPNQLVAHTKCTIVEILGYGKTLTLQINGQPVTLMS